MPSSTLPSLPATNERAASAGEGASRTSDRVFFPGLNAVRAYAALAVVVWHMQQLQKLFHVPTSGPLYDVLSRVFPNGNDAVMLFFVLSGFLITYLLMAEHRRTGTVAVGKFYLRRVLRIWPLYYFLVLLGFVVLPRIIGAEHYKFLPHDAHFYPRLVLYVLMLPNVAMALWPGGIPVGHLWSIGVEEQFYLLWPWLMKWFGRRALWPILTVIVVKVALFHVQDVLSQRTHHWHRGAWAGTLRDVFFVIRMLRLDCMAVGGLAAYAAFRATGAWRRVIYHPVTAVVATALMALTVCTTLFASSNYNDVIESAVYAAFLLCVAAHPRLPRWVDAKPIDFLGRISYGVYMYHVAVMFCLLRYLQKHHATWHTGMTIEKVGRSIRYVGPAEPSAWRNAALLTLVVAITVLVAALSYYSYERFFLRLKGRFTVVRSGSPE